MNIEQQKASKDELCIIGQHHRDPDILLLSAPPVMSLKGTPIERVRVLDPDGELLSSPEIEMYLT